MGVPRASCEEPSARSVDACWEGQPGFAGSGLARALSSGPLPGTLAPRESATDSLTIPAARDPRRQAVLPLSNLNLSCHGRADCPRAAQCSGAGLTLSTTPAGPRLMKASPGSWGLYLWLLSKWRLALWLRLAPSSSFLPGGESLRPLTGWGTSCHPRPGLPSSTGLETGVSGITWAECSAQRLVRREPSVRKPAPGHQGGGQDGMEGTQDVASDLSLATSS